MMRFLLLTPSRNDPRGLALLGDELRKCRLELVLRLSSKHPLPQVMRQVDDFTSAGFDVVVDLNDGAKPRLRLKDRRVHVPAGRVVKLSIGEEVDWFPADTKLGQAVFLGDGLEPVLRIVERQPRWVAFEALTSCDLTDTTSLGVRGFRRPFDEMLGTWRAILPRLSDPRIRFVLVSFVQRAEELEAVAALIDRPVIAKVEDAVGVAAARELATSTAAEALCAASGDLRVQLGAEALCTAVEHIAAAAHEAGCWYLAATGHCATAAATGEIDRDGSRGIGYERLLGARGLLISTPVSTSPHVDSVVASMGRMFAR